MKNYLFFSAVTAMMFAACSNDDAVPLENHDVAAGQQLTLTLNSGGDGPGTRLVRPVNSSEAENNVNFVKLYIYAPDGTDVTTAALATGIQNPLAWTAGPTDTAVPGTTTHEASQTVKLNKLATDGKYMVVAYGYNTTPDYTITNGGPAANAFTATLPALTNESEFFAGRDSFMVVNGNIQSGTNSQVVLRRQVAGLLGYFKNIPVLYPNPIGGLPDVVASVRVYASNHGTSFTFPNTGLMNGTGNNTRTKVLEFNLVTLLTDYAAQVTNAASNLAAVFNIPAPTGAGVALVPNSVLSGKFLIPFPQVASTTTFTVQLEDALGTVLKEWDVVNAAATNPKVYDVNRNYFYSLGQKYKASTTDGGTPGSPTSDDDNPIDLSQETVITLTVNDAWDMIYNLGIE
ncbi:hypothetical protein [Bacteroides sp.]|uniref:hypothetical protein n=1 Tax=Bacteroides sp. TaxID=29523 RepID=UPI00261628D9|nr:hypothetical protein [Bacteroides sp.]